MHDDHVISGLRALGIRAEAIARAMRRGDPEGAIFDAVLMPAIADRTVSASEIERRGGLRVSEVQAFISAFGLRPPGAEEPAFTPEEAGALVELGRLGEVWTPELDVRLGRVWGPLLARVAQAGVQLFRLHVAMFKDSDDPEQIEDTIIVRGGPQNGLQIGFSPSEFPRSHGLSRVLQQGHRRTRRGNLSYRHQARKQ